MYALDFGRDTLYTLILEVRKMFGKVLDALGSAGLDIHAIEILQHGEVALHKCFGGDVRYPVYSVTKSVTSAAFAMLCDDGKLSAEMPLAQFLESRYRALLRSGFETLTFERFLTMTAGEFPFRPQGDNWLEQALTLDVDYSDSGFHYSNIPAYLVGAACENAAGGDLMRYLGGRLFEPLGIENVPYQKSPEGHFYGATGMELTVGELARLGQLFLQKGRWQGEQLISEGAVEKALVERSSNGRYGYGYFIRIEDGRFSFVGKWGQRCTVSPERDLVVAYCSHQPERKDELAQVVHDAVTGG